MCDCTALYTAAVNKLRVNNVINNRPADLPVRPGCLPGQSHPDPSMACSNPASLNVGEMEMCHNFQVHCTAMLSCLSCDGVCVCVHVCMCVYVCVFLWLSFDVLQILWLCCI